MHDIIYQVLVGNVMTFVRWVAGEFHHGKRMNETTLLETITYPTWFLVKRKSSSHMPCVGIC